MWKYCCVSACKNSSFAILSAHASWCTRFAPLAFSFASTARTAAVTRSSSSSMVKSGGFVLELSNEYGVTKLPCAPMTIDPKGAAVVTLQVNKPAHGATEWVTGATLKATAVAAGSTLTVTVPPGNTSFVAFGPSGAPQRQ